jgi:hypothetical protein
VSLTRFIETHWLSRRQVDRRGRFAAMPIVVQDAECRYDTRTCGVAGASTAAQAGQELLEALFGQVLLTGKWLSWKR